MEKGLSTKRKGEKNGKNRFSTGAWYSNNIGGTVMFLINMLYVKRLIIG